MVKLVKNRKLTEGWQFNVAEQIEAVMVSKEKQFETFLDITSTMTSDTGWGGTVTKYAEGWHIQLEGCRSTMVGFIDNDGKLIRKPMKITALEVYGVTGHETETQDVWRRRI